MVGNNCFPMRWLSSNNHIKRLLDENKKFILFHNGVLKCVPCNVFLPNEIAITVHCKAKKHQQLFQATAPNLSSDLSVDNNISINVLPATKNSNGANPQLARSLLDKNKNFIDMVENQLKCIPCNVKLANDTVINSHLLGGKHKRTVANGIGAAVETLRKVSASAAPNLLSDSSDMDNFVDKNLSSVTNSSSSTEAQAVKSLLDKNWDYIDVIDNEVKCNACNVKLANNSHIKSHLLSGKHKYKVFPGISIGDVTSQPVSANPAPHLLSGSSYMHNFVDKNLSSAAKSSSSTDKQAAMRSLLDKSRDYIDFIDNEVKCNLCDKTMNSATDLENHVRSLRHQNAVKNKQTAVTTVGQNINLNKIATSETLKTVPGASNIGKVNAAPVEIVTPSQYFGCEICGCHGMPHSENGVQLHLNSKAHKYMKIFFDNGFWSVPHNAVHLKETKIFSFADRQGTILCSLCQEKMSDGVSLLQHQQKETHVQKLIARNLEDKFPVVYVCDMCSGMALVSRNAYRQHYANPPHVNKPNLANEDCALFYTGQCPQGQMPGCPYRRRHVPYSPMPCNWWVTSGVCPFGVSCRCRHPTLEFKDYASKIVSAIDITAKLLNANKTELPESIPHCYNCNQDGHVFNDCPSLGQLHITISGIPTDSKQCSDNSATTAYSPSSFSPVHIAVEPSDAYYDPNERGEVTGEISSFQHEPVLGGVLSSCVPPDSDSMAKMSAFNKCLSFFSKAGKHVSDEKQKQQLLALAESLKITVPNNLRLQ